MHHAEPEYHGNPVDPHGSLVTWHFGYDLAARILERTRMPTVILQYDRLDLGLRAEYIDVLMSLRPARPRRPGSAWWSRALGLWSALRRSGA